MISLEKGKVARFWNITPVLSDKGKRSSADEMIKALVESIRDHGYFGPELDMDAMDEGQLAGNARTNGVL